jgi:primosomal protein N' (replication factor Y)
VVEKLKEFLPNARILRMDADTTKQKGGHENVLSQFANEEADILVGTQMIVKGHDFPNVTLVGALAADLSLFEQDFRSSERTFDLLTQAAGRAGRGARKGHMIIQTYQPQQYSIVAAAAQDYDAFFKEEIAYRKLLSYPPAAHMLAVFFASDKHNDCEQSANAMAQFARRLADNLEENGILRPQINGPSEASIYRVNDVYRRLLYIKHGDYDVLVKLKNQMEQMIFSDEWSMSTRVYFDFDPMRMY